MCMQDFVEKCELHVIWQQSIKFPSNFINDVCAAWYLPAAAAADGSMESVNDITQLTNYR